MDDAPALALDLAVGPTCALERLYQAHRQGLYALALGITRDPARAEDAVHEAFVRLVERGVPPTADPAAYAFGAVRHAAIDQRRRRRPATGTASLYALEEGDPGRELEAAEEECRLARAVDALPEEEREAVVLRIHAGLGFAQMAEVVGVALSTVYGRYRRALDHLRRTLGEDGA